MVKESKLYQVIDAMPKMAVHHLHSTCMAPLSCLIKLTYYDCVYLNERVRSFKIIKRGSVEEGYIQVNHLRKHWTHNDKTFGNSIALTKPKCRQPLKRTVFAVKRGGQRPRVNNHLEDLQL